MPSKAIAVSVVEPMQDRDCEREDEYQRFQSIIAGKVAAAKGPLFYTDAPNLFHLFMERLPLHHRQHYNCHACRRFFDAYGGLVTIDDDGSIEPVLWSKGCDIPSYFADAVHYLYLYVKRHKVLGVFVNRLKTWGTPVTGEWTHLHGRPKLHTHESKVQTAGQLEAEKHQDYLTLQTALGEYSIEAATQAVRVLEADALDRSEKTLGVAKWFLELHRALRGRKGSSRNNLVWKAAATAAPGWCHIRSTMIGTLLEDIKANYTFQTISERWAKKMHPAVYQRPTAAPTLGAINRAEQLVEQMGIKASLNRRFARLSDILSPLWLPTPVKLQRTPKAEGVFAHLRGLQDVVRTVELPAVKMTWSRFQREVLPHARAIELYVDTGKSGFFAMTTAAVPGAPPILQWDGLEGHRRNRVSWYFHRGGSTAASFNLRGPYGGAPGWVNVTCLCYKPCAWQEPDRFKHQGEALFFVLHGAKDTFYQGVGCGLFPEILRSELHEVRSVIEAHSNTTPIQGYDRSDACGLSFEKGKEHDFRVRVTTDHGKALYRLDRWD